MLDGRRHEVVLGYHGFALDQVRRSKGHRLPARELVGPDHAALCALRVGLGLDRVEVDPDFLGPLLPTPDQGCMIDIHLARPGLQRGVFLLLRAGVVDVHALGFQRRLDFRPALAEVLDLLAGDTGNLEVALLVGAAKVVAQRLEPVGQLGRVDSTDDALRVVDFLVGQGAPLPILPLGGVHDDRVGMRLRIEVAACVVPEHGHRDVAGLHRLGLPVHGLPRPGQLRLDVAQRLLDGRLMRFPNLPLAVHLGHERNTLGRRKRHVGARPVLAFLLAGFLVLDPLAQLLTFHLSVQHLEEGLTVDLAGKPKVLGPLAEPFGMLQALVLGVVVVSGKVVQCLPGAAHVVHTNHPCFPPIAGTLNALVIGA